MASILEKALLTGLGVSTLTREKENAAVKELMAEAEAWPDHEPGGGAE